MGVSSDPARSLYKVMGVLGISSLEDNFDSPEHLPRTPSIFDLSSLDLYLDTQVTFYSGNWINDYLFGHFIFPLLSK
jgi:hypothetical protein